jgi:membrane protein implicated in regulation of membrane protease activity
VASWQPEAVRRVRQYLGLQGMTILEKATVKKLDRATDKVTAHIEVGGKVYEAKSLTAYVDPRREVEVVGFENFSVIVKTVKDRHA